MTVQRFRKKPVEIKAVQWNGGNDSELALFTGGRFNVIDPEDRDDPDKTGEVFDDLHGTWVGVYPGQWIIRGVKGEFYPCADEVFAETYEPIGAAE